VKIAEAIKHLQEALKINPKNEEAKVRFGRLTEHQR